MKKSALVIALAVCLVLAFSASAFAVGPFFKITPVNGSANNVDSNYLSWGYAKTIDAGNVGSPHGNYATTTNKCAVCHAVHRADAAGTVLTPIDLTSLTYTKGCAFCHAAGGSGFSVKTAVMGTDGTISPHTDCNRCHIASPHGAGASAYAVLSARLINTNGDDQIAADIVSGANGMGTVDMTNAGSAQALTLGTGYLCDNCHFHGSDASEELAFPVNTVNGVPSVGTAGTDVNAETTGHRVFAAASTNWNQPSNGGQAFNAYFTGGGAAGATSQVAFDGAQGCDTCHDAKDANGNNAFPHGYVNAAGAYATKGQAGGSLVWLTTAGQAGVARTVLGTPAGGTASANQNAVNNLLSEDGLCLKCHVNNGATAGVGINF